MTRYSRRSGPAADFALGVTMQTVPGLSITRYYDNGELAILARAEVFNATAGVVNLELALFLDGTIINPTARVLALPANQSQFLHPDDLLPITEGQHTIELRAASSVGANTRVVQASARLIVIQLPLWDSDADIT